MRHQVGIVAVFLLSLVVMGVAVGPKEEQRHSPESFLRV